MSAREARTPVEVALCDWLGGQAEQTIDTACAHVFLGPETAFKMKRHADLGYADFSTPEKRLWALSRELEFNQTSAPDIYRAIHRITREADGAFAFEGAGPTVDFVLEMRRFDETKVLAANPGLVDGDLADAMGRTIAGVHAGAPARPGAALDAMDFTVASNARLLREMAPRLGEGRVDRLLTLTDREFARQRPLLAERGRTGFSRRCHGDLHLGNILLEDGQPVLFDSIEFSDLVSDIDVQYDLAFLLMDLDFRGRRDAAVRVLSAYLDQAGRTFGQGLLEGLAALPFMLSVRAAVRAHVSAHSGDDAQSRAYIDFGISLLSPAPPVLAAVGGLSGTGKSSFSRAIAPELGASPGAVVLRTDEARKRLLGIPHLERLPEHAYRGDLIARSYDALLAEARALLTAGRSVVMDATFMDRGLRARVEALAADCGVPFHGVWLEAPAAALRARVTGRTGDASDATAATLDEQLRRDAGPIGWTRVDTSGSTEDAARAWGEAHLR